MFYNIRNKKLTFGSDGDVCTSQSYDDNILVPLLTDC